MKDLIKEITFLTTTILILGLFSSFSTDSTKENSQALRNIDRLYSRCRTLHKERNYHIRHVSKTRKP